MSPIELAIRFIAGGLLITLVSVISETRYQLLAGLAVLFPVVTLTSYFFLSFHNSPEEMRAIIQTSLIALPAPIVFIGGAYLASYQFTIIQSLGVALVGWFVVAGLLAAFVI